MFGVVFWKLASEVVVVLAVVCAYFYMAINGLLSTIDPDKANEMNKKIDEWLEKE